MTEGGDRPARPRLTAQQRAQLEQVFGDVLPEVTSDERGPDAGGGGSAQSSDAWLRENKPPHHG